MTDRQLLQQALDALEGSTEKTLSIRAMKALRERLAHCDRCGKRLGGEGDIHTCTPDPIGDAQDRLIAEMAAQPEQHPVAFVNADHLQGLTLGHYGYAEIYTDESEGRVPIYTTPPAAVQPKQEPVAEVVWGAKTDFEWKFKMLAELVCVEDVPVKLYAGPFKGAALYWHDTETDKGTTPPAAQQIDEAYAVGYSNGMTEGYEAGKAYAAAQHQCKWPTCQSEKYQQALAEQINRELITGVAQRKPLTDAEIQAIHDTYYRRMGPQEFARAIEAAHGIKENT